MPINWALSGVCPEVWHHMAEFGGLAFLCHFLSSCHVDLDSSACLINAKHQQRGGACLLRILKKIFLS